MEIVKYIILGVYVVASGTITGSSTNNFYEQNKGRTKEGKLKRWTIILGIVFVILAVVLSILYLV